MKNDTVDSNPPIKKIAARSRYLLIVKLLVNQYIIVSLIYERYMRKPQKIRLQRCYFYFKCNDFIVSFYSFKMCSRKKFSFSVIAMNKGQLRLHFLMKRCAFVTQ